MGAGLEEEQGQTDSHCLSLLESDGERNDLLQMRDESKPQDQAVMISVIKWHYPSFFKFSFFSHYIFNNQDKTEQMKIRNVFCDLCYLKRIQIKYELGHRKQDKKHNYKLRK